MDKITYEILGIYLTAYILLITITGFILPRIKMNKLKVLLKENPEIYLKKIDSYYRFTVDKGWKNGILILKIFGWYKLKKWDEVRAILSALNLDVVHTAILDQYCEFIILVYLEGNNSIAEELATKFKNANFKNSNGKTNEKTTIIQLMNAVQLYYNGDLVKSGSILYSLNAYFNSHSKSILLKYAYYYLGLIAYQNGNRSQSKLMFDRALAFCPHPPLFEKKVDEVLEMFKGGNG